MDVNFLSRLLRARRVLDALLLELVCNFVRCVELFREDIFRINLPYLVNKTKFAKRFSKEEIPHKPRSSGILRGRRQLNILLNYVTRDEFEEHVCIIVHMQIFFNSLFLLLSLYKYVRGSDE